MSATENQASEIFEDEETDHVYTPTEAELDQAFEQIMSEIREYGMTECASFVELHDHCDANTLGGFCEDRYHWTIEAMNSVHDRVDAILRANSKA